MELLTPTSERRFLLTNPDGLFTRYHGVVLTMHKQLADGWSAQASYTFSRGHGLQAASPAAPGDAQASTVAPAFPATTFGRDPNSLTNGDGRLPNDRPHMFRGMVSAEIPRTGLRVAAIYQHYTGKPWAAAAQVRLPQGDQRILIEQRGARRLSSQDLLDIRVARTVRLGRGVAADLFLDVLNALDETAEENLVSDVLYTTSASEFTLNPNFGRPSVFVDPRRAMLGVKLSF